MLSLDECRRLLGASELSDAEVLELRDHLYELAGVLVEEIEQRAAAGPTLAPEAATVAPRSKMRGK